MVKITPFLTVMNSRDVKELRHLLENQFGITQKLDLAYLRSAKDKVYVINKTIDEIDIEVLRIDSAGMYIGTFQIDGFRLSIEGSQLFGQYAAKNVIELSLEQKHEWLKGHDIEINEETKMVLIKYKDDFLGSAKIKNGKILNSVPKSRRLIVVNE